MKGMGRSSWWVGLAGFLWSAPHALAGSIALSGTNNPSDDVLRVPEGGSALVYLLLAGIACFGAMIYSRHRSARVGTAEPPAV